MKPEKMHKKPSSEKLTVNNSIAFNKTGRFIAVNRQLRHLVCGFVVRNLKIDSSTLDQRGLIRKIGLFIVRKTGFFSLLPIFQLNTLQTFKCLFHSDDEDKMGKQIKS